MGNTEHKIDPYVDDIILIYSSSGKPLTALLTEIDEYSSISNK